MSEEQAPEFSQVYEAYHGRVLAYAGKLIGRDDAEDVVQEVFVKILRSLDTVEDPSKLTSWIYAITINTVRDALRKRSSRVDLISGTRESEQGNKNGDDVLSRIPDGRTRTPEERVVRNEMVTCYLDYVKQLPPHYYDVYALSELEELSDKEIARRLRLSLGTVKIRLHRARAMLYEVLRRSCQCYYNERGELMGRPKDG